MPTSLRLSCPDHLATPRAELVLVARAMLAALLLVVGSNALSLPGRQWVGRYDFGYAIRGDRFARPAQVFDDGAGKIYFEARPGAAMPAVFAGSELELLVLQPEGQYFSARTGAGEFTLVLGAARASVRRGSTALGVETVSERDDALLLASVEPGLPAGIALPGPTASAPDLGTPVAAAMRRRVHEQPVVFPAGSAALRPEVLAALTALVLRIGHEAAIVVEGGDDGGGGSGDGLARSRAFALRNALLARGVAASRLDIASPDDAGAVASASASAPPRTGASLIRWTTFVPSATAPSAGETAAPAFDIAPADRDIATSLRRWAHASGYELVWDLAWSAPVNGALRLEAPTFPDAVRQVVAGLRAQGYPVRAQAYADRVVRFSAPE